MQKGVILLGGCAAFLLAALLLFPQAMLAASAAAVSLWLGKVFPSLFPFLVACGILFRIGAAERMGQALRPLPRLLFGLGGAAAFPLCLGLLSGYPMGAKLVAMGYAEGRLSRAEAAHILVIANQSGPLFLIGTVGVGFFGAPLYGYALLLAVLFGAIATGILWRFRRQEGNAAPVFRPASPIPSAMDALSGAVSDAVGTILLIGGYLVCFAALSEAPRQFGVFALLARVPLPFSADALRGVCSGLLEITNGAYQLSLAPDGLRLRLTLTAFLVSFGGLSILGQTFGVLAAVPIAKKDYLKGKLCNALFSSLFLWFCYPVLEKHAQKAVPVFFLPTETARALSLLSFLPYVLLLAAVCLLLRRRKGLISPSAAPECFPPARSASARNNRPS